MSNWIQMNWYLTQAQMENNAEIIARYFLAEGWTKNAIAGMLANMQAESTVNPGIWEGFVVDPDNRGFGLVQWTPASKFIDWAAARWPGSPATDGYHQCARIIYELQHNLQWISTSSYPMSFAAFTETETSPEDAAYIWMYNYERPGDLNQPWRRSYARAWYEFLGGVTPSDVPIWLLFKLKERSDPRQC